MHSALRNDVPLFFSTEMSIRCLFYSKHVFMCWREIWNCNLEQQGKTNYNLNAQTAPKKNKIKDESLI